MNNLKNSLLILSSILCSSLDAQSCGSCDITISSASNSSYTVSAGQLLCITSSGKYTGSVTLDGGAICNEGVFKPTLITINTGTINNYNRFTVSNSFTIGTGFIYYSENKSFTRVAASLFVQGGSYTNKGISNIGGSLNCSSGNLVNAGIVNCSSVPTGSNFITNTGIINHD